MKPQTFAVKILSAASAASFYQIVFLDRNGGFSLFGGFQLCFQRLGLSISVEVLAPLPRSLKLFSDGARGRCFLASLCTGAG